MALNAIAFNSITLPQVIVFWVFACLVVAACVINIRIMCLPDWITIGGSAIGLLGAAWVPSNHGASDTIGGLIACCLGIIAGYVLMLFTAIFSKRLFGNIEHEFDPPTEFEISQPDGHEGAIIIRFGSDIFYEWQDVFFRRNDKLRLDTQEVIFNDGETLNPDKLVITADGFQFGGQKIVLEQVAKCSGVVSNASVPREIIGHGNVKFLGMIGAFMGVGGVLWVWCVSLVLFGVSRVIRRDSVIAGSPIIGIAVMLVGLVRFFSLV